MRSSFEVPTQQKTESIGEKLSREVELLSSLRQTSGDGVRAAMRETANNPSHMAVQIMGSALLGTAISVAARNPAVLGKALEPALRIGVQSGAELGALALCADLGHRISDPVLSVWRTGQNLESDKQLLAASLGRAAVDYTMMGTSGVLGAKCGTNTIYGARAFLHEAASATSCEPALAYAGSTNFASSRMFPVREAALGEPLVPNSVFMRGRSYADTSKNKPPELKLTGKVEVLEAEPKMVEAATAGDLFLFPKVSGQNNHYVSARVFDGTKLRAFDLVDIVGVNRAFFTKEGTVGFSESATKISACLKELQGEKITWRKTPHNRTYLTSWPQYRMKSVKSLLKGDEETALAKDKPPTAESLAEARPVEVHRNLENVPDIKLSGNIHTGQYPPETPRIGDLHISYKTDSTGRYNREHGHANYGYSGYFRADIHDGQRWKPLDIWKLVGEENARFDYRYQIEERQSWLATKLRGLEGSSAQFNTVADERGFFGFEVKST